MGDMLVQSTSLAAIADAIRAKCGISGDLSFPYGFIEAINAIEISAGQTARITVDNDGCGSYGLVVDDNRDGVLSVISIDVDEAGNATAT